MKTLLLTFALAFSLTPTQATAQLSAEDMFQSQFADISFFVLRFCPKKFKLKEGVKSDYDKALAIGKGIRTKFAAAGIKDAHDLSEQKQMAKEVCNLKVISDDHPVLTTFLDKK